MAAMHFALIVLVIISEHRTYGTEIQGEMLNGAEAKETEMKEAADRRAKLQGIALEEAENEGFTFKEAADEEVEVQEDEDKRERVQVKEEEVKRVGFTRGPLPASGGLGPEMYTNAIIQEYCNSIIPEFQKRSHINPSMFVAISYRIQIVSGIMYYVKVDIGGDQCCHLKIFEPIFYFGQPLTLDNYQCGMKKTDPIERF